MIGILQSNSTTLPINKTMLDYCLTIPQAVHYCFDFAPIRNGKFGDDITIEFNGKSYIGHVNAKHVKRATPAYQVSLPSQLRKSLASLLISNAISATGTLNLRIDATTQKLYLI